MTTPGEAVNDELRKQRLAAPESVRKIIDAAVSQALARCDSLGISREDFYRVMLEEQKAHPNVGLAALFELIFRRFEARAN